MPHSERYRRDSFHGREDELRAVAAAFLHSAVVTLTGPGGGGKTRLAREFAAQATEIEATWFVSLADRNGVSVEESVAAALGVPDRDSVIRTLARQETLLVLDNLEHVLDGAAEWITLVTTHVPTLRVLATSREPLGLRGEQRVEVPPLDAEAGTQLFLERARARGADPDRNDVRLLVERLGGIPLVVELAASRALTLSPAMLVERLGSVGLDLLASRDRDLPARHRAVRAVIDWSWDLLDEAEQGALARCGAFRGSFDLPAAEHVLGRPDASLLLDSLVTKSLVSSTAGPGPIRFSLLEPIRLYAEERLSCSAQAEEVLRRHAEWFAHLGSNGRVGRCPQADFPNLAAAHRRFISDAPLAARLTRSAEFCLRIRRALSELRELGDAALQQSGQRSDAEDPGDLRERRARAWLLRARGGGSFGIRRLEDALSDLEEAWEIALELADDELIADVGSLRATALLELGRHDDAKGCIVAAREAAMRLPFYDLRVDALQREGLVEFVAGDWDVAMARCRESIDIAMRNDDEREAGRVYAALGLMQKHACPVEVAQASFARAIEISERHADDTWKAVSQLNLADLLLREGHYEEAEGHYREGREVAVKVADRQFESAALLGLGTLVARRGGNPRELLHSAIDVLAGVEVFYEKARAYSVLGIWEILQGNAELADDLFRRAIEKLTVVSERPWIGLMWAYRACAAAIRRMPEEVAGYLWQAATQWEGTPLIADLQGARVVCDALLASRVPAMDEAWARRGEELQARAATGVLWLADNHIRSWFALTPPVSREAATLELRDEGRCVLLPDGAEHDFSRRGPLRLMVLALARAQRKRPGECLSVEDLLAAGYPDEVMTADSGRMRVYTAIRRLRKLGFAEVLLTRDEGYLLDPELRVSLDGLR